MKIAFALIIAFGFSLSAEAQTPVVHAGFQAMQFSGGSSSQGTADAEFIHVKPANPSSTKRDSQYQILSTGQIADSSALNWKQPKNHTYIVLPVTKDMKIDSQTPGKLKVMSASGLLLHFKNGSIEKITDENDGSPCEFTANKNSQTNQRDFTIESCKDRIVFDAGLGTSNGAYANLTATTKVTDGDGVSCTVKNSTLFAPGRTKFDARLKTQSQIYAALKALPECASLNLASLKTPTVRPGAAASKSRPREGLNLNIEDLRRGAEQEGKSSKAAD